MHKEMENMQENSRAVPHRSRNSQSRQAELVQGDSKENDGEWYFE